MPGIGITQANRGQVGSINLDDGDILAALVHRIAVSLDFPVENLPVRQSDGQVRASLEKRPDIVRNANLIVVSGYRVTRDFRNFRNQRPDDVVHDGGLQVLAGVGVLLICGGNYMPVGYDVAVRTIDKSGAFYIVSQAVIVGIAVYSEPGSYLEV